MTDETTAVDAAAAARMDTAQPPTNGVDDEQVGRLRRVRAVWVREPDWFEHRLLKSSAPPSPGSANSRRTPDSAIRSARRS